MATTTHTITAHLHGGKLSGGQTTGGWPNIDVTLTMEFTRNPGDSTVTWAVTSINCPKAAETYWGYGFKFIAKISVEGETATDIIISKDNEQHNYPYPAWWTDAYTTFNQPTGSFTSTENMTVVRFFVNADCYNGTPSDMCFAPGDNLVYFYEATIPPYEVDYTISYDGNGDSVRNVPGNQTKTNTQASIQIPLQTPSYLIDITYHDYPDTGNDYIDSTSRIFGGWSGSDGNTYTPLGYYTANADCVMTAIWGDATFIAAPIPDKAVIVTYQYNGGTGSVPATALQLAHYGYATSPSGSKVIDEHATVTTATPLDLYPKYGNATLHIYDLPIPTRAGYSFDGWFYDQQLTERIIQDITTSGDITIYAKWIAIPIHQLTINGDWGSNGPYVWRFNGTSWEKVAHVYKYNGTNWIDLSQG